MINQLSVAQRPNDPPHQDQRNHRRQHDRQEQDRGARIFEEGDGRDHLAPFNKTVPGRQLGELIMRAVPRLVASDIE